MLSQPSPQSQSRHLCRHETEQQQEERKPGCDGLSFLKVKLSLDALMDTLLSLSDVGDCVNRVEQLLKELRSLEEKAQVLPHLICSCRIQLHMFDETKQKCLLHKRSLKLRNHRLHICVLQPTVDKAQLHALHGDQLIQSDHYALDSIRPKCVELRRICDNFSNEAKKKKDVLSKSLQIHTGISKVSWS